MGNITINIKNCGCGGGTKTAAPADPFGGGATGEWGNPVGDSGPPEDFSIPTSGLADRQCKVAVWLYDWLDYGLDTLANTDKGDAILIGLRTINLLPGVALRRLIAAAIPVIISLFNGPDPTDAAVLWISWAITGTLIPAIATVDSSLIKQPLLQDALLKIRPEKNEIICQLSKAPDAFTAFTDFQKAIQSINLTFEQKQLILGFMPRQFFNLLYYTSDFWPSFDEDYLAGITTTCCGGYTDGDPVTPQSQAHCQAQYYIVQQLAATMTAVADTSGIWYNANPFDDDRNDIYQWLDANLATPRKIRERAYSYPSFLNAITEITYSKFFILVHFADLSEFSDFAAYILSQEAALIAALDAAADADAAYTALQPLRDWINDINNVSDTAVRDYMLQSLDALIKVKPTNDGLLDLLFIQDSDLANYALGNCGPGGGGGNCPSDFLVIYGSQTGQNGSQYTFDSQALSGLHWVTLHIGQDPVDFTVCGPALNVTIDQLTNFSPYSFGALRIDYDEFLGGAGFTAAWSYWRDPPLPALPFASPSTVRTITLVSGTAFSATLTIA